MSKPYKRILPAYPDASSVSSSSDLSPTQSSVMISSKRKRHQVSVACSACQKRKSKCDAERPSCSLCRKKCTECVYEIAEEMSRIEARKRDNDEVVKKNERLEVVMEYLRVGSDAEANEVLRRLRNTRDVSDAVEFINDSATLLNARFVWHNNHSSGSRIKQQAMTGSEVAESGLKESLESFSKSYAPLAGSPEFPTVFDTASRGATWDYDGSGGLRAKVPYISVSASPWTSITTDNQLVSHLLCIFFTWEYPCHGFIDQDAFLRSMKSLPEDTQSSRLSDSKFCSPLLVNAILAKACQCACDTLDYPSVSDITGLGRLFYEEASRQLDLGKDTPTIPTMQAAWVLFTYECLQGKMLATNRTHSTMYRMYDQLGLAELEEKPSDYDCNAEAKFTWDALVVIVWGCYIRDSMDSLAGGWFPKLKRPRIEFLQMDSQEHPTMATNMWFPYPVLNVPVASIQQELMVAMINLADITHTVLELVLPSLHQGNEERKLEDAMEIYGTMQAWQDALPERLQPEFGDVAHVYLLHMQFNAVVICLLRPFQEVDVNVLELEQHPRSQCSAYATHTMSILWAYRARWGLARCSSILQGLMTVAFKLLFHLKKNALSDKAFKTACQGLSECSRVWSMASLILLTIKSMAARFELNMPGSCDEYFQGLPPIGRLPESDCGLRIPTVIPSNLLSDANGEPRNEQSGAYDGQMMDLLEYLKDRENKR